MPALMRLSIANGVLRLLAIALLVTPALLSGCSTIPATGKSGFTGFMSVEQERQIGAREHPKVIEAHGGVYNGELGAYVAEIGGRLAVQSEYPASSFRFTLLNSPAVNAFALPGGYVYVTRGILALANDEAELAGVIGHEITHVTARHSAQRYSSAMSAGFLGLAVGVLTGNGDAARLFSQGSSLYLLDFSREQEFESDKIGIRYMQRAGYDPFAMGDFHSNMEGQSAVHAKVSGRSYDANRVDYFSTHPRTSSRVKRAHNLASETGVTPGLLPRKRDTYLSKIDGMIYGDHPDQGFVRGRRFSHPNLRFEFKAPEGYSLSNHPQAVTAMHPDGAQFLFDIAPDYRAGMSMSAYVSQVWAPSLKAGLANVSGRTIGGKRSGVGIGRVSTRRGAMDLHLIATEMGGKVYRFIVITEPRRTSSMLPGVYRMIEGLRRLSKAEAAALKPLRVRIVTVRPGDTVFGLSKRMAFDDHKVDRFRALNGLKEGQGLRAGQKVKIITE